MIQPYFEGTPGLIVCEDDVRRLILSNQKKEKHAWLNQSMYQNAVKFLTTLFIVFVIGFVALNAPALYIKFRFYFQNEVLPPSTSTSGSIPNLPVPGQALLPKPQVSSAPAETKPKLADNHIYINRIGVDAPIIWDISNDNNTVLKNLQNGVVQLKSTAKPGENGNIFIVGHSSNLPWIKGDYNHIFALITDLKGGDVITIMYQGKEYNYRVTDSKVINPDDLSVLNSNHAQLTLMTCVPIGTNLRRLVVIAQPIDNLNLKPAPAASTGTGLLPSVR